MTFVSIPVALAVLILTILALSFAWSFRLAHKLDKAYEDYDLLHAHFKNLEGKYKIIKNGYEDIKYRYNKLKYKY